MEDILSTFEYLNNFLNLSRLKYGTKVVVRDKILVMFIGKDKHIVSVKSFSLQASSLRTSNNLKISL